MCDIIFITKKINTLMVTVPIAVVNLHLPAASRKELGVTLWERSAISVFSRVFCIVCGVRLFEFFNCCQVLRGEARKAASIHVSQVTLK